MTITYHTGDAAQTQTHTVKFEKKDPAQGPVQSLPLKRNHLYTVKLSNSGGGIRFTLTVADWNQGDEFAVSSDEIGQGASGRYDYSQAALGDIMLKDGSLVKPESLTPEQKPNAIGVVAYFFAEGRAGAALISKLGRKPKGVVMALKNASLTYNWSTSQNSLGVQYQKSSLKQAYTESYEGYVLTEKAKGNESKFDAFHAAINYERDLSTKAPQGTSGWYLPSMGEWIDILGDTGLGQVPTLEIDKVKNEQTGICYLNGEQITAKDHLNNALNQVGTPYVDTFDVKPSDEYYWSSSYIGGNAYCVSIYSGAVYFINIDKKKAAKVRSVLAF